MSLSTGTRLGSYEIVSLLGEGGMGEVYRARDLRLQREIALKILPDAAASDAARRERFTREALAVAALNHPHIVTIHSVEDAGSHVVLAMELVEGRSLAQVLPAGGLPLDRLLTVGIAVAEAMSAAHQKGITHRDLKPANVMLGEGEHAGRIKVLDFGLAKRAETPFGFSSGSMLPTADGERAAPITGAGQILGTVAYMSPEQAEGKAIDARSDLFSLGVVLYEMATGERPFTGDTSVSVLASIVKDTPKSVTEIKPALPPDLGRIIRRALAKDPERRYQSAKDLRNDLEDLRASLPAGQSRQGEIPHAAPAVRSSPSVGGATAPSSDAQVAAALVRKYSRPLLALNAVLVLAFVGGLTWFLRRDPQVLPSEGAERAPSIADVQITQLTTSGIADRPSLSPDGRYVVYVQHVRVGESLWLRQTTTESNVQIVSPQPRVMLFGGTFTPDATSVDFVRQAGNGPWEVWPVAFLGGTSRRFIADVASPISWSPDGRRFAFIRTQSHPRSIRN